MKSTEDFLQNLNSEKEVGKFCGFIFYSAF